MKFNTIFIIGLAMLLVFPALANADAFGCTAGQECRVQNDVSVVSGSVFQYSKFILDPGVTISVQRDHTLPDFVGKGGNISISAKELYIAGQIVAPGMNGAQRIGYENGGNGGTIVLRARDLLSITSSAVLSVIGGNATSFQCQSGTSGTGGSILLLTSTTGTAYTNQGKMLVTGGNATFHAPACQTGTNTTASPAGSFTTGSFTPVVKSTSLSSSPANLFLNSGEHLNLTLTTLDEFDSQIYPQVTWTNSNTTIASVSSINSTTALVYGLEEGDTHITASIANGSKTISMLAVVVTLSGEFTNLELVQHNSPLELSYGQRKLLAIFEGRDEYGNRVELQEENLETVQLNFENKTLDLEAEAELVSGNYLLYVTAGSIPGNTRLVFSDGESALAFNVTVKMPIRAVTSIELTPLFPTLEAGQFQQFTATAKDASGYSDSSLNFTWEVKNQSGRASITQNGRLQALGVGDVAVIVYLPGSPAIKTTSVEITLGKPHHLNVTGPQVAAVGQQTQYGVTVRDILDNIVPGEYTVLWTTNAGTMYQNGTLYARTASTRNIPLYVTAALANNSQVGGTMQIVVLAGEPNSLLVEADGKNVVVNQRYELKAFLADKYNNPASEEDANWQILNGTGSAILQGNVLIPTRAGSIRLYAVSKANASLAGTGIVNILPGKVATLQILPPTALIRQGDTVQLDVIGFDSQGNQFTPTVNWTLSSGSGYATINQNGTLYAYSSGNLIVRATYVENSTITSTIELNVMEALDTNNPTSARLSQNGYVNSKFSSIPVQLNGNGASSGSSSASAQGVPIIGGTGLFTAGTGDEMLFPLIAAVLLVIVGAVYYYKRRTTL